MAVLTRDVIAGQLADRAEITKVAARDEVKWFFECLAGALTSGDEVRIQGFGTFKISQRKARLGRNPQTGEAVQVPARRVVRFSPATTLNQSLKGARRTATTRTRATKATAAKASATKTRTTKATASKARTRR